MTKLCECGCGQQPAIAPVTSRAKGWVKGEPKRFVFGHHNGRRSAVVATGERYGRLLVVRELERRGHGGGRVYECLCDCGERVEVISAHLRSSKAQSCGCLHRERLVASHTSHGMSGTGHYASWVCMVRRCTNPHAKDYKNYGGRGIAPCASMATLDGFHAALGDRPEGRTVDRIDNDGGYWCGDCADCRENGWPLNVRWATAKEQRANQRPPRRRNSRA